jgi:hypothetical protein
MDIEKAERMVSPPTEQDKKEFVARLNRSVDLGMTAKEYFASEDRRIKIKLGIL